MAILNDLIISGASRFIGKIYASGNIVGDLEGTASKATKDASGNTITSYYEPKSNVTSKGSATQPIYFDANGVAQNTTYTLGKSVPSDAVFTDHTYSAGTGVSLNNGEFSVSTDSLLAGLPAWTADPSDNVELIRRDTGGSAAFGRIKFSTVWNYISGKISSVLGLTSTNYGGKAATAGNADTVNGKTVGVNVPADAKFTDTNTTYSAGTGLSLSGTTFSLANSASAKEAYIGWGGRNITGGYSPIDAAMVSDLGANRFAFANPAGVVIEYSRDGGTTWTDYGATDAKKRGLFSLKFGGGFRVGKVDSTMQADMVANPTKYLLRVKLRTGAASIYSSINKLVFYISSDGSQDCWVTLDVRTQGNYSSNVDTWENRINKMPLTGWSGYNVANISTTTTYGNTSAQYGEWRFTFGFDGYAPGKKADGTYNPYYGFSVGSIFGFGGMGWTTPSNMASSGHLYSYDDSQNATFPATVSASKFSGAVADSGNGAATTFAYSKAGLSSTSWLAGWNGNELRAISPANVTAGNASKVNNHTVESDVPANAVFTDHTYTAGTGLTLTNGAFAVTSDDASEIINQLPAGTADPVDGDYYVAQYAQGGTTNVAYRRRTHSALWRYIKSKIGIIGGKNLILGTSTVHSFNAVTSDYFKLSNAGKEVKAGEELVLSFEAKASVNMYCDMYWRSNSESIDAATTTDPFSITTSYQKYTSKVTVGRDLTDVVYLRIRQNRSPHGGGEQIGDLYIKNLKLERGNIGTDWTPAIEDLKPNSSYSADKLDGGTILDGEAAINGFMEANKFKYASFQHSTNAGVGNNDGMVMSIPWGSDANYGTQMIFDGANPTVKVRGRVAGNWNNWQELIHTGNMSDYTAKRNSTTSGWVFVSAQAMTRTLYNEDASESVRDTITCAAGSDTTGDGTMAKPFRTLTKAFDYLNRIGGTNDARIRLLTPGTYDIDYAKSSGNATFTGMVIHIKPYYCKLNEASNYIINFTAGANNSSETASIKFYVSHVNLQRLKVKYSVPFEFDSGFAIIDDVVFESSNNNGVVVNGGGFASFTNVTANGFESSNARASFSGTTTISNSSYIASNSVFNFVNSDVQINSNFIINRTTSVSDKYFIRAVRSTIHVGTEYNCEGTNLTRRDAFSQALWIHGGLLNCADGKWSILANKSNGSKHSVNASNVPDVMASMRRTQLAANSTVNITLPNNTYTNVLLSACGATNNNGNGLYLLSSNGTSNASINAIKALGSAFTLTASGGVITITSTSSAALELSLIPLSNDFPEVRFGN